MADTALGPDSVRANTSSQHSDSTRDAHAPDLCDVHCWLEQAGGIVELLADKLLEDKQVGSAIGLSLFGAVSLIERARSVTSDLSRGSR